MSNVVQIIPKLKPKRIIIPHIIDTMKKYDLSGDVTWGGGGREKSSCLPPGVTSHGLTEQRFAPYNVVFQLSINIDMIFLNKSSCLPLNVYCLPLYKFILSKE